MTNPGAGERMHTCDPARRQCRDSWDRTADILFGPYFGTTALLRTMFLDKLWTMKNGEDITLSCSVRHHTKVPVLTFAEEERLLHLKPVFAANIAPQMTQVNSRGGLHCKYGMCGDGKFVGLIDTPDRKLGYMVDDPFMITDPSSGAHWTMIRRRLQYQAAISGCNRRLQYNFWLQGWATTNTQFAVGNEPEKNAILGRKPKSF